MPKTVAVPRRATDPPLDTVECVEHYWSLTNIISAAAIDRTERGRSCRSKGRLGSTTTARVRKIGCARSS